MTETDRFQELILQILRERDMETGEIYMKIKQKEPSLCDDRARCIHNGIDYGQPEWKHLVRNAQQVLKKKGMINNRGVMWSLNR